MDNHEGISPAGAAEWVARRACRECRQEADGSHPGCVTAHAVAALILQLDAKLEAARTGPTP